MPRLIENTSIKKRGPRHKVYCQEDYAQELYEKYCDYFEEKFSNEESISTKDLGIGSIVKVTITSINEKNIIADTEFGQTLFLDYVKESKFFQKNGTIPQIGMKLDVMIDAFKTGTYIGSTESAFNIVLKRELMDAIKTESSAYEVTVKSINDGGFIVNLSGLNCFLPGSLAAANKIVDFQSMIGKNILVMVETYLESSDMFVVSAKKYIKHILPSKIKELDYSSEYTGKVTGVKDYGVFVEWDEIFTGLLHSTETSGDSWKNLKSGDDITFYIKDVKENNRIILSQNGPNPEYLAYSEFKDKYEDEICEGVIKDIKPFGVFIEIGSVTGMMPPKEFRKYPRLSEGDSLEVLVKQVDAQAKRIYLKHTEE